MHGAGQARQIILRIELPSREGAAGPPSLVVVRLDHLSYAGARAQRPACRCCGAVALHASACTARIWQVPKKISCQ